MLEALQHLLKLAMAKRYKQNLKLLLDVNGYREQRKRRSSSWRRGSRTRRERRESP